MHKEHTGRQERVVLRLGGVVDTTPRDGHCKMPGRHSAASIESGPDFPAILGCGTESSRLKYNLKSISKVPPSQERRVERMWLSRSDDLTLSGPDRCVIVHTSTRSELVKASCNLRAICIANRGQIPAPPVARLTHTIGAIYHYPGVSNDSSPDCSAPHTHVSTLSNGRSRLISLWAV